MSKNKSVLGRGLDALIRTQREIENPVEPQVPNTLPVKDSVNFKNLDVDLIDENPFQPRNVFDPAALEELKTSIVKNGLITPITVRNFGDRYQLISGERRLRAFKEIGYPEIPAYIIIVESDDVMLAMALIENIQREKLNPVEIGLAYRRLMDDCGLTQDEIADRVGKDRSTIANSLRILKLPAEIKEKLISEELSMGQARALITLPDKESQLYALQKILEENLSVRKVEVLVRDLLTKGISENKKGGVKKKSAILASDTNVRDIEDKLKHIFGTKVQCKFRKSDSGDIVIEFYSSSEFDGIIDKLLSIS